MLNTMEFSPLRLTRQQLILLKPGKCNGCWRADAAADDLLQEARIGNITAEDACEKYIEIGERCLQGLQPIDGSGEYFCTNPQLFLDQTPPLQ